jgi:hypothetical protein
MNFFSPPMQKKQHKFCVITTFNDVKLDETCKPLVICDIDHTFIRCLHSLEYFRKILYDDYKELPSIIKTNLMENSDKEAVYLMNRAYNIGFVKQTDPEGFNNMLKNIEHLGGNLIFLTARGIESHKKTINDLKRAGLENPENFDIHYTNSEMTKGEYLKKTNLTNGYQHISFIDDYPSFLTSVQDIFPHIHCYLFTYD